MAPQHKGMVVFTGSMVWREMQEASSWGVGCYLRGAAAVGMEPLGSQRPCHNMRRGKVATLI